MLNRTTSFAGKGNLRFLLSIKTRNFDNRIKHESGSCFKYSVAKCMEKLYRGNVQYQLFAKVCKDAMKARHRNWSVAFQRKCPQSVFDLVLSL